MATVNGGSEPASTEAVEEDDFDINAEVSDDDQTPAPSAMEQEEESAEIETDDEEVPDDVGCAYSATVALQDKFELAFVFGVETYLMI